MTLKDKIQNAIDQMTKGVYTPGQIGVLREALHELEEREKVAASGMTAEREGAILEKAVETYGRDAQTDMAIEEMAELTKALLKFRRYPTKNRTVAVLEEMADVYVMLNQLCLIYGDPSEWEEYKLARLEAKLNNK